MNERLEQKCIEYIDANFTIDEIMMADVSVSDRQYVFWLDDIYKLAQYFYNLALADVREELEVQDEKYRTMRVSKESTIQQAREADLVVYVLHGLNNFVDRLNK